MGRGSQDSRPLSFMQKSSDFRECHSCPLPAESGKKRCAYHLQREAEGSKIRRAGRKMNPSNREPGVCSRCGCPSSGKTCPRCREYGSAHKFKQISDRRAAGLCGRCGKLPLAGLSHCQACLTWQRNHRKQIKQQVIEHYGGQCCCCGEKIIEFLTIDHVRGDGADDRKRHKSRSGYGMYSFLKRAGHPHGYQVLCWNCNLARGLYGACPHGNIQPMTLRTHPRAGRANIAASMTRFWATRRAARNESQLRLAMNP